jgi:HEAT repeat protein
VSGWKSRPATVERLAATQGEARHRLIAELVATLRDHSEDLDALNTAVETLARLGDDAVPPLLQLLGERVAETRLAAILALGLIGNHQAIGALMALLDDPDANVAYHAIEALGNLRARQAAPRLAEILRQGDFFLLFPALTAAGRIGDPALLPELLELLDNEMVAEEAVDAIGACRHALALPGLARKLEAGELPWTRLVAACEAILSRYDATLAGARQWEQTLTRRLAARSEQSLLEGAPGKLSKPAARGATRLLRALAKERGWRGDQTAAGLLRALELAAAAGVTPHPYPLAGLDQPDLQAVLARTGPAERLLLAQLLGHSQTPHAGPILMQMMRDPDEGLRRTAALAFRTAQGSLTVEELLPLATAGDPAVVAAAQQASDRLEPIDEARWATLLGHTDPAVRRWAARAARQAKSLPGNALFARMAEEDEPSVRAALLSNALHRRERVYPWLAQNWHRLPPSLTAVVAGHLGLNSRGVMHWLELCLRSPDVWTRLQAARFCTEFPELARQLGASLKDALLEDPFPPLRAAGLMLLPKAESRAEAQAEKETERETETRLQRALGDPEPEVARTALFLLGARSTDSALEILESHFRSCDREAQRAMLEALAAAGEPPRPAYLSSTAATRLGLAMLDKPWHSEAAVALLWQAGHDTPEVRALALASVARLRPEWLRPPAGTLDLSHVRGALWLVPLPEATVSQAAWFEAAMYVRARYHLLTAEAVTPFAERSRLLGLLEAYGDDNTNVARFAQGDLDSHDPGLASLARRILGDHCAEPP